MERATVVSCPCLHLPRAAELDPLRLSSLWLPQSLEPRNATRSLEVSGWWRGAPGGLILVFRGTVNTPWICGSTGIQPPCWVPGYLITGPLPALFCLVSTPVSLGGVQNLAQTSVHMLLLLKPEVDLANAEGLGSGGDGAAMQGTRSFPYEYRPPVDVQPPCWKVAVVRSSPVQCHVLCGKGSMVVISLPDWLFLSSH